MQRDHAPHIDVFDVPDPADTPDDQRRTWAQRAHDAIQTALQVALDAHSGATVGGVKTHVVVYVDLFTLLGADALARIQPRLSLGGGITPDLVRHLIASSNPTMRAVLGLGPWQPVSVGPYSEGGTTELHNEVPLCHTHNVLKHDSGWRVTFDVRSGIVTWTSKDGRRIITLPPPDL